MKNLTPRAPITARDLKLKTGRPEFDHMILAAINQGIVPPVGLSDKTEDETIRRQNQQTELALLYVAATRARKTVLVTSYGVASPFLQQ